MKLRTTKQIFVLLLICGIGGSALGMGTPPVYSASTESSGAVRARTTAEEGDGFTWDELSKEDVAGMAAGALVEGVLGFAACGPAGAAAGAAEGAFEGGIFLSALYLGEQ